MIWALVVAVTVVGGVAFVRARRNAAFTSLDPVQQLRAFELAVLKAGRELADERGWDDETRECSMGQALGLLTQGLVNACEPLQVPPPTLAPYNKRTLELAKLPMLSTTRAVIIRLSKMGVVPRKYCPKDRGRSLEMDMAERIADAPTRAAMGLIHFRVDGPKRTP